MALGAGVVQGTVDGGGGVVGAGGHGGDEREADAGVDEGLDGLQLCAPEGDSRGGVAALAEAEDLLAQAVAGLHDDELLVAEVVERDGLAAAGEAVAGGQGEL